MSPFGTIRVDSLRAFDYTGNDLRTQEDSSKRRQDLIKAPLDPARAAAFAHLATLAHGCPDLFPLDLDQTGLNRRQTAFASAIVDLTCRRWLTLRWLIEQHLTKPFTQLQPELGGVLLAGASQLLFLDGVPAYAAINESVEWAKQTIRPGAGGLANAVLRRIAGLVGDPIERIPEWTMARNEIPLADGTAIVLKSNIMPEEERMRFGIATSCPSAVYNSMLGFLDEERVREIALHNMAPAPTVLNIEHSLASTDIPDLDPHETPGFAVYRGNHRGLLQLLDSSDDIWVQDSASAKGVHLAAQACPSPGLILDLCAGRGTKTRQLAAVFPDAKIIATDTNDYRRETLRSVFQWHDRVGVMNPEEMHCWLGQADMILLDVPCTNTGTLARRVEARYRATDTTVAALVTVQRQIIANTLPMLAKGGTLVYSTCSLDPRENHQQALWAAKQHRLRITHEQTTLPEGLPGESHTRYCDGSYTATLTAE